MWEIGECGGTNKHWEIDEYKETNGYGENYGYGKTD